MKARNEQAHRQVVGLLRLRFARHVHEQAQVIITRIEGAGDSTVSSAIN
jgi:hypothetical protein